MNCIISYQFSPRNHQGLIFVANAVCTVGRALIDIGLSVS